MVSPTIPQGLQPPAGYSPSVPRPQTITTNTPTTQQTKTSFDVNKAYKQAVKTFNDGMGSFYLSINSNDPRILYKQEVIKELVKQQRSGNIQPRSSKLFQEQYQEAIKQKSEILMNAKALGIPTQGRTLEDINSDVSQYVKYDVLGQGYSVNPEKEQEIYETPTFTLSGTPNIKVSSPTSKERDVYNVITEPARAIYNLSPIPSYQRTTSLAQQKFYYAIAEGDKRLRAKYPKKKIKGSTYKKLLLEEQDLASLPAKASYDVGEFVAERTINPLFHTTSEVAGEVMGETFLLAGFLGPASKTATAQITESTYADEVVEVIINGKKVKILKSQLLASFKSGFRSDQLRQLRLSFKNRYYLDKASFDNDLKNAVEFMRQSGLTEEQIADRVKALTNDLYKSGQLGFNPSVETVTQDSFVGLVTNKLQKTSQVTKQVVKQTPKLKRVGELSEATNLITGNVIISENLPKQETSQSNKPLSNLLFNNKAVQTPNVITDTFQVRVPTDITKNKVISDFLFPGENINPPMIIRTPTPTKGLPDKTKTPIPLRPGDKEGYKKEVRVGYDAYGYEKNKYKKLNERPQSKSSALDIMARFVDNTLSSRGKVKPITQSKTIKGKKVKVAKVFNKPLPPGDGYYESNKYKFRNYRVLRGNRIPTNTFTERKRYRLDKLGETKKIVGIRERVRRRFRL